MKIAIIGTGIAGLTCGRFLRDGHAVTLFEANSHIGGHVHTHDVSDGKSRFAVDTGFIVFNEASYPNFTGLLRELVVASQPTRMSFSLSCQKSGLEFGTASVSSLFAQRKNLFRPGHHRLIKGLLRFNKELEKSFASVDPKQSVAEYVKQVGYSREFVEDFLKPISAALWSCPLDEVDTFPMHFIMEFYLHHQMHQFWKFPQWRVISGGSREYVRKLAGPMEDRIRLNTPVQQVKRLEEGVMIQSGQGGELFDEVIFACHANQALELLGTEATALERELLGAFPYSTNTTVLHTDERVLPRNKRAWACWNYRRGLENKNGATVTYNMNMLQSLSAEKTFCVSLNLQDEIHPDKVLKRMTYQHPAYRLNRWEVQRRQGEVIRTNRTSFCGAYWGNGFHEAGLVSALRVLAAFDRLPSWSTLGRK